jgi:bifunctional UDP-N-acetylglucosamine pyrophosphorylase/glucosamine-1-phosphate N-acetyltransferase
VEVVRLDDPEEALGINDRVQLARAERVLRERLLNGLMLSGVTIMDPVSCFVEAGVEVGEDTVLEPFTMLRGRTRIGSGCRIGPYAQITDSEVGEGCWIESSWLRECKVGAGSDCGPYSKLRPGTELEAGVHVGSFAEIVRSRVATGSKIPHFSYVGDAVIGENVNIGAGTVTVNYDGREKHRTEVGDGAFIGSDTMLRAPVRIGRGSRTGAGSVVISDVPDGETAVGVPARVIRRRAEDR